MASQGVLTSWKEIAAYLGKGVRTVQRWEAQMGLPVRRPGPERHIVLAFPAELDEWAHSGQRRPKYPGNTGYGLRPNSNAHDEKSVPIVNQLMTLTQLSKDLQRSAADQRRLRQQLNELRNKIKAKQLTIIRSTHVRSRASDFDMQS